MLVAVFQLTGKTRLCLFLLVIDLLSKILFSSVISSNDKPPQKESGKEIRFKLQCNSLWLTSGGSGILLSQGKAVCY
jgi:hypothetical protein